MFWFGGSQEMSLILPEYFWAQSNLLSLWSVLPLTQSNARQVMRDNTVAMLYVNRQGENGSFWPWQEPVYLWSHVMLTATQLPGLMNSVEHQLWRYFFSFFSSPCVHVRSQKRYNRFCRECQSYACFPSLKAWKFKISEWLCDLWVPDLCGLLHTCSLIKRGGRCSDERLQDSLHLFGLKNFGSWMC